MVSPVRLKESIQAPFIFPAEVLIICLVVVVPVVLSVVNAPVLLVVAPMAQELRPVEVKRPHRAALSPIARPLPAAARMAES